MLTSFPVWNNEGVIPPIDVNDPASRLRSPYVVSLSDVVQRFATTPERSVILQGFLEYRAALHMAGLTQGFQWLNGSFMENKELMSGAAPGDIDVVTFFHLPTGVTEADIVRRAPLALGVDGAARKQRFHVDAFLTNLARKPEVLVERSAYWYGLFAHSRRNFLWKGFLQVDLSSVADAPAASLLATLPGGIAP